MYYQVSSHQTHRGTMMSYEDSTHHIYWCTMLYYKDSTTSRMYITVHIHKSIIYLRLRTYNIYAVYVQSWIDK